MLVPTDIDEREAYQLEQYLQSEMVKRAAKMLDDTGFRGVYVVDEVGKTEKPRWCIGGQLDNGLRVHIILTVDELLRLPSTAPDRSRDEFLDECAALVKAKLVARLEEMLAPPPPTFDPVADRGAVGFGFAPMGAYVQLSPAMREKLGEQGMYDLDARIKGELVEDPTVASNLRPR